MQSLCVSLEYNWFIWKNLRYGHQFIGCFTALLCFDLSSKKAPFILTTNNLLYFNLSQLYSLLRLWAILFFVISLSFD